MMENDNLACFTVGGGASASDQRERFAAEVVHRSEHTVAMDAMPVLEVLFLGLFALNEHEQFAPPGAVASGEVSPSECFFLSGLEVREGVETGGAVDVLLGEPELVSADEPVVHGVAEERRVVRVENELRGVRIGYRALEHADQVRNLVWMQVGVELVDQESRPVSESLDEWADQAEPDDCAQGLVAGVHLDLAPGAAMPKADVEVLDVEVFLGAIGVALQPFENPDGALKPFTYFRIDRVPGRTGDAQVGHLQHLDNQVAALRVVEQLGGERLAHRPALRLGELKVVCEPGEQGEQGRIVRRPRRRQEQGVRAEKIDDRAHLGASRPARLLDMVDGRSNQAFKTWLAEREVSWRNNV